MEIILVMGYPASGKSTYAAERYATPDYVRLNRDAEGGTLADLVPQLEAAVRAGAARGVVLDNTYPTVESRRPVLAVGKAHGVPVRAVMLGTTIEQAQYNAVARMIAKHGKFLQPDELKAAGKKDPNLFPPTVLFRYRKQFEKPTAAEGFAAIETVAFARRPATGYTNKALLLDYDGTLRRTKSGEKYPRSPDDVEVIPGRREVLERYARDGYRLLGVSNQGDVARGKLTAEDAVACFERTNALLGVSIEYAFCPHDPAPIGCYCRKPMPGLGVAFIEKYKLDPAQTVMVGDMTSDKTFAERVGVRYVDQAAFFG
jgi:histidinol-phosphate phosphatase family protein